MSVYKVGAKASIFDEIEAGSQEEANIKLLANMIVGILQESKCGHLIMKEIRKMAWEAYKEGLK